MQTPTHQSWNQDCKGEGFLAANNQKNLKIGSASFAF
jgi:hypothetical protein